MKSAFSSAAVPGRMEKAGGGDESGVHATPARLSVFDAPLIAGSITPQMRENLDDELTEVKSENAIDRITSQANPRTLERVPAGARFQNPHGARSALRGRFGAARAAGAGTAPARRRRARRRRLARQRPRQLSTI